MISNTNTTYNFIINKYKYIYFFFCGGNVNCYVVLKILVITSLGANNFI